MTTNKQKAAWAGSMVAGAKAAVADVQGGATFAQRLATIEQVTATAPASAMPVRLMNLEDIRDRESDIRPINGRHVLDLALSVSAVGLLQFPVVDEEGRLLAGGHRREALQLLRELADMGDEEIRTLFSSGEDADPLTDEDLGRLRGAFARDFAGGVVVRVFDTSGLADKDIKLKVEAIENEKRLDFTKDEIAGVVERLKAAGYKDTGGRPKEGQRVLSQELERIMGKSRRTVFRLLQELKNPSPKGDKDGPSDASKALARELSDSLGTKVSVREAANNRGEGSIVIHYSSFKQRADILREMGIKR